MKKITPIVIASGNGAPGLAAGIAVLRKGGSALDAVEACARVIESDPSDTSVGRGGKPNVLGVVELDASIVDGTTHRVGAVGVLILTGLTLESALKSAKGEAAPDRVIRSLDELFGLPEFHGV